MWGDLKPLPDCVALGALHAHAFWRLTCYSFPLLNNDFKPPTPVKIWRHITNKYKNKKLTIISRFILRTSSNNASPELIGSNVI